MSLIFNISAYLAYKTQVSLLVMLALGVSAAIGIAVLFSFRDSQRAAAYMAYQQLPGEDEDSFGMDGPPSGGGDGGTAQVTLPACVVADVLCACCCCAVCMLLLGCVHVFVQPTGNLLSWIMVSAQQQT